MLMRNSAKSVLFLILTGLFSGLFDQVAYGNAYLIIYATKDGKTGHAALAIDNYQVEIYDILRDGKVYSRYDTVKNGTLTYFDLWPKKDHFRFFQIGKNVEPIYHKLPQASYKESITVSSILEKGVPNVKAIPCDGLICFKTSPIQDLELYKFLDSVITVSPPFNVRRFNCSDFAVRGLEIILHRKIRAREFIPLRYSTTPNKLFRKARKIRGTIVVKDPEDKIKGSFFKERILKMLFMKNTTENSK
jgi:hypothetical protein